MWRTFFVFRKHLIQRKELYLQEHGRSSHTLSELDDF